MGEEIRGMEYQSARVPSLRVICQQEVLSKYQESKKELDELVASMEGL